jgi:microsomal epoxide hydrolase
VTLTGVLVVLWLAVAAGPLAIHAAPQSTAAAATTSRFFTTSDGVRLHYLERGHGQTVVFIPGWTMPARIWERQLEALGRRYRVIALDPRNQGQSERTTEGNFPERRATDVKELIAHAGAAPAVLAGWSLGVREALTYVRLFGTGTLRGLILVDGQVWTPPSESVRRANATFIHDFQTRRAAVTPDFVRRMFATPQDEAYLAGLTRDALAVPTSAAVSMLTDLYLENDMRQVVGAIDVPVLVAVRTAHTLQATTVRELLPSADTEIFERSGHALFVDEADRFNRRCEAFLSALTARRQGHR